MVTTLSSVRLSNAVERVVNPEPAAVTVANDAPPPKMRSVGFVVVAAPLFMAAADPDAPAATSSGFTLSRPEYSWI